jgi:hypothetical protein
MLKHFSLARLIALSSIFFLTGATASVKHLPAPLFNNLGSYHRSITTDSPLAQRYFDRRCCIKELGA